MVQGAMALGVKDPRAKCAEVAVAVEQAPLKGWIMRCQTAANGYWGYRVMDVVGVEAHSSGSATGEDTGEFGPRDRNTGKDTGREQHRTESVAMSLSWRTPGLRVHLPCLIVSPFRSVGPLDGTDTLWTRCMDIDQELRSILICAYTGSGIRASVPHLQFSRDGKPWGSF